VPEDHADTLDDADTEFPEAYDEIERAKWSIDGARTLAEAAEKSRAFADRLQALHDEGYVLRRPVEDDHAFYYKPDQETEHG
jgi:hypothetical protein